MQSHDVTSPVHAYSNRRQNGGALPRTLQNLCRNGRVSGATKVILVALLFRVYLIFCYRLSWTVWSLLLIPYLPIGFFIFIVRLCMTLQLMLMFTLVPNGWLKRLDLQNSPSRDTYEVACTHLDSC